MYADIAERSPDCVFGIKRINIPGGVVKPSTGVEILVKF